MKTSMTLMVAVSLLLAQETTKEGMERGLSRYERDACKIAKERAKREYNVTRMDTGCLCEMTDGREWLCFIRFDYEEKPE